MKSYEHTDGLRSARVNKPDFGPPQLTDGTSPTWSGDRACWNLLSCYPIFMLIVMGIIDFGFVFTNRSALTQRRSQWGPVRHNESNSLEQCVVAVNQHHRGGDHERRWHVIDNQ